MQFKPAALICFLSGLINLPFIVLAKVSITDALSAIAMGFCFGLAVASLLASRYYGD